MNNKKKLLLISKNISKLNNLYNSKYVSPKISKRFDSFTESVHNLIHKNTISDKDMDKIAKEWHILANELHVYENTIFKLLRKNHNIKHNDNTNKLLNRIIWKIINLWKPLKPETEPTPVEYSKRLTHNIIKYSPAKGYNKVILPKSVIRKERHNLHVSLLKWISLKSWTKLFFIETNMLVYLITSLLYSSTVIGIILAPETSRLTEKIIKYSSKKVFNYIKNLKLK